MKDMVRGAAISADGKYRYQLWRDWDEGSRVIFIMLNPSTADASKDDPTIRKCIRFAIQWGYSGVMVINLFAYRAINPRELKDIIDPWGEDNKMYIEQALRNAGLIVAAWGGAGPTNGRRQHAIKIMTEAIGERKVYCFGKTKEGHPKHPLYMPADARLELFMAGGEKV